MIKDNYDAVMKLASGIVDFPWADPQFYAAWLTQSYFYTSHTTRILLMAGAHCKMDAQKIHMRFAEHAREEKHHELLAVKDVKELGHDVNSIGEFPITQAFYRSQYYIIQHEGVASLFGWILFLEGLAIEYGKIIRDRVKSGHSKIITRFLDVHVNEDPDHVEKAMEVAASFQHDMQKKLIENMYFTADMYLHILKDCYKRVGAIEKSMS